MSEGLYIVAHEQGLEGSALPTWADHGDGVIQFSKEPQEVTRVDIPEVPGAFQLLNVLSSKEADQFRALADNAGFHEDSPVSLPHHFRHNENLNWVVSEEIGQTIWQRGKHLVSEIVGDQKPHGINARFRFYKYGVGDFFKPHTDGAWPGSRVIDGELVANAYPELYSQYTYLIFLSDGYEGGHTQFFVSKNDPSQPAKSNTDLQIVNVKTPKGAVLCFPHGMHPLHCLHGGEEITKGLKYIIRTEILFG